MDLVNRYVSAWLLWAQDWCQNWGRYLSSWISSVGSRGGGRVEVGGHGEGQPENSWGRQKRCRVKEGDISARPRETNTRQTDRSCHAKRQQEKKNLIGRHKKGREFRPNDSHSSLTKAKNKIKITLRIYAVFFTQKLPRKILEKVKIKKKTNAESFYFPAQLCVVLLEADRIMTQKIYISKSITPSGC